MRPLSLKLFVILIPLAHISVLYRKNILIVTKN